MKPRQRQAAILEYLQKQGKCSVEELAQYFDTTLTSGHVAQVPLPPLHHFLEALTFLTSSYKLKN